MASPSKEATSNQLSQSSATIRPYTTYKHDRATALSRTCDSSNVHTVVNPISTTGFPPAWFRITTAGSRVNTHTALSRLDHSETPITTPSHPAFSNSERHPPSKQSSATTSLTPSPFNSRDTSPTRQPTKPTVVAAGPKSASTPGLRSRKSSQQDLTAARTPRSATGIPGPPASSRTLSAATTPTLLPNSQESFLKLINPQKTPINTDVIQAKDSPRWPVSPRLRSPPPQLNKPQNPPQPRRSELETPKINLTRAAPSPQPEPQPLPSMSESETDDSQLQSGVHTPVTGSGSTLETVQEVSLPNSPGQMDSTLEKVNEKLAHEAAASADNLTYADQRTVRLGRGILHPSESMSDTGTKRSETIRPKKDKRKTSRKQPTVNPGNASSKADIFEAKVASAVDEANTSDSEETFVYDSNPPDVGERRRYHSRTPSATSMISQADRAGALGMRSIHEALQGSAAAVGLKKSMKFVNTFNSSGTDNLVVDEDGKGSGRSVGPGSGRGTTRHHHHNHFGRWGRQPGNSHPSILDNESLFPNAARSKLSTNNSRQSSGPPSPRVTSSLRGGPHALGKRAAIQLARYDADDTTTTGADDERTPLLTSTVRSARRTRRHPANLRNLESQTYRQQPSYLNRFAACLVVTMMLLLVITGAIGFMFATSQPLTDIELVSIKNVLASDPELMFDLTVKAHNPNIVVVSIDQANLEIFAKSPHAGTDFDWWKRPHDGGENDPDMHIRDDPPDDPPDDDAAPNMRLGTITEFDSPLSFEGSFFNKGVSASTGTMRLHLPGNHSAGGSERWGRVIQDEFDLIVKGVVRYSLPLSQRVRSAPISGRTTVKPNSANDPSLRPNMTLPGDLPNLES
ncbi:Vacuolar segregation protein 7 [Colletotrichum orbiculare MAFF 240422]|uniref:Vacuolar segregation protein 7 n=1 Tax=Colletotrichum orbiculare (strain 104-T / ATCC 96160 / CBS 514.97 / LARS 414 / MAFF 240422) TaxID=1213857 RepID=A0A484G6N0_COLOR|nr:Vacuolar segregation protein 7 [Colletotrichum orbiculare MAFF 240422]